LFHVNGEPFLAFTANPLKNTIELSFIQNKKVAQVEFATVQGAIGAAQVILNEAVSGEIAEFHPISVIAAEFTKGYGTDDIYRTHVSNYQLMMLLKACYNAENYFREKGKILHQKFPEVDWAKEIREATHGHNNIRETSSFDRDHLSFSNDASLLRNCQSC